MVGLLELKEIYKEFPSFKLGPVNLKIKKGIIAILGPSGSGKTTLLNIIAGIIKQDKGTITLNGREIDHLPPEKRHIGYVFQDFALFPHLNVRENLLYGGREGDLKDLVNLLNIGHLLDRDIQSLSSGERQRVAIARTLLTHPELLMLDEPMGSIDENLRKKLWIELRNLLRQLDIPVILVTHSKEEAMIMADQVVVMGNGRIHQYGSIKEIYEFPSTAFVANFMGFENVFQGTVTDTNPERDVLKINWNGTELTTSFRNVAPGTPITFGIRPENIMIVREGKPVGDLIRDNIIEGNILRILRKGGIYEVIVSTSSGYVTVDVPDHVFHRIELNKKSHIKIGFKRNKIHFMESLPEN